MKIVFACDHNGFFLRDIVKNHLVNLWHEVIDVWPKTLDPLDDFPTYTQKAVQHILQGEAERGVLICGSGVGMSIAANRFVWIRAVLAYSPEIAKISRSHNDANIICFGGLSMSQENILSCIDIFLTEPFIGQKYQKRNNMIDCSC